MNFLHAPVFIALLAGTSLVNAACEAPEIPSAPDGSTASMDDMIAGQQAVKAFQAANTDYLSCIDSDMAAKKAAALEGNGAAKADYEAATDAYNAAVANEEAVASAFNSAIRAYKAANPQ